MKSSANKDQYKKNVIVEKKFLSFSLTVGAISLHLHGFSLIRTNNPSSFNQHCGCHRYSDACAHHYS